MSSAQNSFRMSQFPGIMKSPSNPWADAFRFAGRALVSITLSIAVALLFPVRSDFRKSSEEPAQLVIQWDTTSDAVEAAPSSPEDRAEQLGPFVGRVMLRLEEAEKKEANPHFRDDLRISWVTCLYAARNEPRPFERATISVLGILPDQIWPRILANRKAKLGEEFARWYDEDGISISTSSAEEPLAVAVSRARLKQPSSSAEVPKKPSQTITGKEEAQHA